MHCRPTRTLATILASVLVLSACSSSLDESNENLPPPVIAAGFAADACGSVTAGGVTLDVIGTRMTENSPLPQTVPGQSENVVTVPGTATGLAAGQSVYGLVIASQTDCPLTGWLEIAPSPDGSFIAVLDPQDLTDFRVVFVTGPSGATPTCAIAGDCIQLDAAGTLTNVTGISGTVSVSL